MISEEGIKRIAKTASDLYTALTEDEDFTPEFAMKLTAAAMPALVGRV